MAERIEIMKTYKLYINGSFVRSESGRYFQLKNKKGEQLANCSLSSRKDFRNAVQAARKAQAPWVSRSAYNIGQILYRIAENLEGRKLEIASLIAKEQSVSKAKAEGQVNEAIDRVIYFAGWTDKFQQVFSSVNPVASSHFNFSILEPTGVVGLVANSLISYEDFITSVIATICSGNSLVALVPKQSTLSTIVLAEVLHHSDLPSGVVNILSGEESELLPHFTSHMDVNALLLLGNDFDLKEIGVQAANNLKRIKNWDSKYLKGDKLLSPYSIKDFMEVKTTWHPIEQTGVGSGGY